MKEARKQARGSVMVILGVIAIVSIVRQPPPPRLMEGLTAPFDPSTPPKPLNATECEKRLDDMDSAFEYQRKARQEVMLNSSRYPPSTNAQVFYDPYEPEAVCLTEERFGGAYRYGSLGDGPKFVCGMNVIDPTNCLVYNVGSNNDIDFEQAVSQEIAGCEIHTFDPTLKEDYIGYNYSHFHPWGLGNEGAEIQLKGDNIPSFTARSFAQIVNDLGHANRTIDILKIDCEECEYEVMPLVFYAIQTNTIPPISQIQIELHATSLRKKKVYRQVNRFFTAADDAGYRIFHKERNHWGCDGFYCVEYSLVHTSFLRQANAAVVCGGHDYY